MGFSPLGLFEAVHILLHGKKQKFIDLNTKEKYRLDQEADGFGI